MRWRADCRVLVVGPETTLVVREDETHLLSGRDIAAVAKHIDGTRDVSELIRVTSDELDSGRVCAAVEALDRLSILTTAPPGADGMLDSFWASLGVESAEASRKLRASTIDLRVAELETSARAGMAGSTFTDAPAILGGALVQLGASLGSPHTLRVVVTDDYANPSLDRWNREALETRTAWLLTRPLGRILWIGPVFVPGRTGCWQCLAHRLAANRWADAAFSGTRPIPGAIPASIVTALSLTAHEAAKWLVLGGAGDDGKQTLMGALWTLDITRLESARHELTRRPQCSACGGRAASRPVRVTLVSQRATAANDGGFRVVSAEQTVERLSRHISPYTGILPSMEPWGDREHPPFLCFARHGVPKLSTIRAQRFLRRPGGAVGKGFTIDQAKASCLAEAVERYSAVFDGRETRVRARFDELGDDAIHPNDVMLFSESQYRARESWNRSYSESQWVPEPFDPAAAIDWTPLWSLSRQRIRFLPTALAYLEYLPPVASCRADANGCASGNVLEEAVLQAFLELIERDAAALWWYSRAARPEVSLLELGEAESAAATAKFASMGRRIWALDITSDFDVPSFVAVSSTLDGGEILFGLGTHLNRRVALRRSVAELYQVCLPLLRESGGSPRHGTDELGEWLRTATTRSHPFVTPSSGQTAPGSGSGSASVPSGGDLHEPIESLIRRASDEGLEVFALDLTRPDIDFPVVRLVVPGMRHFWARLAPGRLYDVPLRLGWTRRRLTEGELNPLPLFL